MTSFGREGWIGWGLAGGLNACLLLSLQLTPATAAPVTGVGADESVLSSPGASEAPPQSHSRNDRAANATAPPREPDLRPRDLDLTGILSPSTGAPGWRIPMISQRAYLSGDNSDSTSLVAGSLPLTMAHPFDATPLLRQSADLMSINALLADRDDDATAAGARGESVQGWTDQPISTDVNGGDGSLPVRPHAPDLGTSFFSAAIENLGATDSQRELVKKALLDLKKYIAVPQPVSQDMILQNQSDQPPVTVSFNSGDDSSQTDQPGAASDGSSAAAPVALDDANNPASEYTQMFSISSIWEFLTSSTMIVLYILMLALWAAWRYAIRRFV